MHKPKSRHPINVKSTATTIPVQHGYMEVLWLLLINTHMPILSVPTQCFVVVVVVNLLDSLLPDNTFLNPPNKSYYHSSLVIMLTYTMTLDKRVCNVDCNFLESKGQARTGF